MESNPPEKSTPILLSLSSFEQWGQQTWSLFSAAYPVLDVQPSLITQSSDLMPFCAERTSAVRSLGRNLLISRVVHDCPVSCPVSLFTKQEENELWFSSVPQSLYAVLVSQVHFMLTQAMPDSLSVLSSSFLCLILLSSDNSFSLLSEAFSLAASEPADVPFPLDTPPSTSDEVIPAMWTSLNLLALLGTLVTRLLTASPRTSTSWRAFSRIWSSVCIFSPFTPSKISPSHPWLGVGEVLWPSGIWVLRGAMGFLRLGFPRVHWKRLPNFGTSVDLAARPE